MHTVAFGLSGSTRCNDLRRSTASGHGGKIRRCPARHRETPEPCLRFVCAGDRWRLSAPRLCKRKSGKALDAWGEHIAKLISSIRTREDFGQSCITRDQKRLIDLLCGYTVQDKRGSPQQRHLKNGSADEKVARRALAQKRCCTTIPLDLGLRFVIAELIDPDCDEIDRRIRFVVPAQGQAIKCVCRETDCRIHVGEGAGRIKERSPPFASATNKFGLGRSRVLEIWTHWQPIRQTDSANR